MNPTTGEIQEFSSQEAANRSGYTVPLRGEPNPKCKKCYGRGHIGRNDQGQYVPCSCCLGRQI